MTITTSRKLLTDRWTAEVDEAETTIRRFHTDRKATNDCRVAFFEIPKDGLLHVNVIHKHRTANGNGWAGPASIPDGFVHNRTFAEAQSGRMVHHIRSMVFAAEK